MAEQHLTADSPDPQVPPQGFVPVERLLVLLHDLQATCMTLDIVCRAAVDPVASAAVDPPQISGASVSARPEVTAELVYFLVRNTLEELNHPFILWTTPASPEEKAVLSTPEQALGLR